ncbi:hypothetical protein [Methylobacterium nodulans]|uniref:Uncharacterized protein n=1 Tax=Methylobacterium nodulans (strain LMG 21967 / CNCM I-2342 / ORS 2060) TaxID=460265 RepID=B8IV54_METNO|nr:hypothetical protein [Methylobacterium nodulans]ACL59112.1 hypothetical protein Mnod_4236 [Methylobacterium nodulans ORS 2060]
MTRRAEPETPAERRARRSADRLERIAAAARAEDASARQLALATEARIARLQARAGSDTSPTKED